MNLEALLERPCAWFVDHDPNEIAVSSRIRLARNVDGVPFPAHADAERRADLRRDVLDILRENSKFADGMFLELDEVRPSEKMLLFERSLISKELVEECEQSGLAVSPDTQDVVMVNEEDHLRLQVVRPGLSLREAWEEIVGLDDDLEAHVHYAFSETRGYLTCCPSNTGRVPNGRKSRLSVMRHT